MLIEFIAHAGICVKEEESSVLIDPWFADSRLDAPLMQSIGGGHQTIDFQIPPARSGRGCYAPDAILLSHLHAHHSNREDVIGLVEQSVDKPITVAYPTQTGSEDSVRRQLAEFSLATALPCVERQSFTLGRFQISSFEHTVADHRAWYVRSASGSVLHIADARFNKDRKVRSADALWQSYAELSPDVVFLSAGGNSIRFSDTEQPVIAESVILSPVEAAQVVQILKPKVAVVIGCYNHSIWRNRVEYIRSSAQIEEEFEWALSWLLPNARHVRVRPGHRFGLGDESLAMCVDTYLPGG
jgi:L-ascorbate metabolism protein UlaG (beta-lactamase superfamily)